MLRMLVHAESKLSKSWVSSCGPNSISNSNAIPSNDRSHNCLIASKDVRKGTMFRASLLMRSVAPGSRRNDKNCRLLM